MAIQFEQSRQDLLDKLEQMRHKTKVELEQREKEEVVVYGEDCPFIDGLLETLEKKFTVKFFDNHEDASMYCIEHLAIRLVLHMDLPTDWKMATDVFTTVKMMRPDMNVVLCSKTPTATAVETLAKQKAKVLPIPFGTDVLFQALKIDK